MLEIESSLKWDGVVGFGVLDESEVTRLGLIGDGLGILDAVRDGRLAWKRSVAQKNRVTNYARSYMAQILTNTVNGSLVLPSKAELGTGTGTPAPTDTDLWTPAAGTLKPCSGIQVYLTYYAQYVTTWQSSDPIQGTWTEIGLKDSGGNLWAHAAITSNLTVNAGEILVSQWAVQILGN